MQGSRRSASSITTATTTTTTTTTFTATHLPLEHRRAVQRAVPKHAQHRLDVPPVQRRHHRPAALAPDVAVGRDQPLAHHKVEDLREQALGVVGRVGDEDLLGELRVGHDDEDLGPEGEAEDLSFFWKGDGVESFFFFKGGGGKEVEGSERKEKRASLVLVFRAFPFVVAVSVAVARCDSR